MNCRKSLGNVMPLNVLLRAAQEGVYAVGSFSPRCTPLIRPILRAAKKAGAPVVVQISQRELERYGVSLAAFAERFYTYLVEDDVEVPAVLHLDHTKDFHLIAAAIECGFTSVMIDASEFPLAENAARTSKVVAYAHPRGVSVEAELGRIGSTDSIETEHQRELLTDPEEAQWFAAATQVDALAVSVGTAHGAYMGRKPEIDYERIKQIRTLTPVPLVLHGGSGVPQEMIRAAVALPGGGISKVNFATDLELAFLAAVGRTERLTERECRELSPAVLDRGLRAVEIVVEEKIVHYLGSAGRGRMLLIDTDLGGNACEA
ncbi:MAG: class II fructose-bisphosphate aldolase [Limnochordia bacterium]